MKVPKYWNSFSICLNVLIEFDLNKDKSTKGMMEMDKSPRSQQDACAARNSITIPKKCSEKKTLEGSVCSFDIQQRSKGMFYKSCISYWTIQDIAGYFRLSAKYVEYCLLHYTFKYIMSDFNHWMTDWMTEWVTDIESKLG